MGTYLYQGEIIEYIAADDESSRYLIRTKGNKPLICLGLNPSVANKVLSDATIKRVEKYAEKKDMIQLP